MAEALKDRFSRTLVEKLARALAIAWPRFDSAGYTAAVLDPSWPALELKQRMRRLSSTLPSFLPLPYRQQLEVLKRVAPEFGGLEAMLFPDFVEQFGLDDFRPSVEALEWFTQFSSSEFAARPFLVRHPARMLKVMRDWAGHENEHVRRLASEGSRPRLPWAMALPEFQRDPSPTLPILEALRDDPSEYVRRSVANHLNDIAKDHPDVVLDVARRWRGKTPATDALVKHACRTLLKRGDQRALALFGFHGQAPVEVSDLRLSSSQLRIGDALQFEFTVRPKGARPLALRLEYALDFVKASGRVSRKVFQITEATFPPAAARNFARQHAFRDLTTRRHHPGEHRLSILVNGLVLAHATVSLAAGKRAG